MSRLLTLHSMPEMRHVPASLRTAVALRAMRDPTTWLVVLVMAVALAIAGLVTLSWSMLVAQRLSFQAMLVSVAAVAALCSLGLHQFLMRMVRAGVKAFVHRHYRSGHWHICLHCGYDQRGTAGDHCPECGAAVERKRSQG
ncbi:MAG: hypothetical protein WD042_11585 [Phycisphaeraceae bacterium]